MIIILQVMKEDSLLKNAECKRCKHKWHTRIPHPLQCPNCKCPKWDTYNRYMNFGTQEEQGEKGFGFTKPKLD